MKMSESKVNILLLDCDDERRIGIEPLLKSHVKCIVDSRASISRNDFETGEYNLCVVHSSNPEGRDIEFERWIAENAKIILFSGGYTKDKAFDDGIVYVRDDYLESSENVCQLLVEVLEL